MRRWTALTVLTTARIVMGLQFQSVGALSPLLRERLGVGGTEIGILIGLFSLPGVALALPGGMLGRRLGDRRLVLGGLLSMAAGSAMIGMASTFATAAAGRFLTAVGAVLLNVLGAAMVADLFSGREMVLAMALFINAWPIGTGLALLALPAAAGAWGLAAAFHVGALAAGLAWLAMAVAYPRPPRGEPRGVTAPSAGLSRREIGLVSMAAMPWLLYNVAYAVTLGFAPAVLVGRGLSVEHAGTLLGLTVAVLVGSVQIGGAAARWLARPERIVAIGLVAFGAAVALLPYASPLACLVVIALLAGLPAATLVAAPAGVLRAEQRAAGMGVFYTWYYAGMASLPAVAGVLQDLLGQAAALEFAAAAALATLLTRLMFRAATA